MLALVSAEGVYTTKNYKCRFAAVYRNLFNRLPKHRLSTIELRESSDVTVEECARGCVVETSFKCKGFNYKSATRTCVLLEQTPSDSNGAVRSPDSDYYERGPGASDRHLFGMHNITLIPKCRLLCEVDYQTMPSFRPSVDLFSWQYLAKLALLSGPLSR